MHEDIELFVVNAHCRMIFKRNTHTHTPATGPQQRCTLWNGFDLQRIRAHWECDTLTQPTQCVSVHRYSEWENEKCRIMKVCIGVKPIHFSSICGIKKTFRVALYCNVSYRIQSYAHEKTMMRNSHKHNHKSNERFCAWATW